MSVHMAIHETRATKYKKEASKAQARIDELIGDFDESEGEYQPRKKRPRTIGLKRALEWQKEEEKALLQSTPLTALFEQEIENNKEVWLERVNDHLEKKLERENRYLELQRRMMKHYQKLNQFARRKLKAAQEKLKEAKGKRSAQKVKKGPSGLQIFSTASEHISKNP